MMILIAGRGLKRRQAAAHLSTVGPKRGPKTHSAARLRSLGHPDERERPARLGQGGCSHTRRAEEDAKGTLQIAVHS